MILNGIIKGHWMHFVYLFDYCTERRIKEFYWQYNDTKKIFFF